ncbi:MAG TPA: DOMON domain-containing protein [Spirochaetia bacterium]|nr:DOMON domain-containing protein [Spirochaetales bacterium]HRS64603.1 DOMON domain-containing protein [Spirochaetia bacterium]HOT59718.1 DOMON domain-containing protein [Spirochaetales bacterium]HPD79719.1 DOMON domain-containing protein [Spirochaetales bacterium]HQK34118.1 DOMON domain-containing protein [Spirochaetales bacterium]
MKTKVITLLWALTGALSILGAVDIDGAIAQNEYSNKQQLDGTNFVLYWQIEGDTIYFAIESTAKGWVSIGFEPTKVMANADMVFGIVGTTVQAIDAYSTGQFGPHPADTDQGGTNDILAFAGKRTTQGVVFEFSRKLASADSKDKPIVLGKDLKLIWAWSNSLTFTAKHARAGTVVITVKDK